MANGERFFGELGKTSWGNIKLRKWGADTPKGRPYAFYFLFFDQIPSIFQQANYRELWQKRLEL